jgi:hypothetical protein
VQTTAKWAWTNKLLKGDFSLLLVCLLVCPYGDMQNKDDDLKMLHFTVFHFSVMYTRELIA